MTEHEKIERLQKMVSTTDLPLDADTAAILLDEAKWIVLNRRYPFGGAPQYVPRRFESVQVKIAAELCNRMGTYGQTNHTEDGMQRIWETGAVSPSLLKQIVPLCGVPSSDDEEDGDE